MSRGLSKCSTTRVTVGNAHGYPGLLDLKLL